jgi:3D (Asp-Asp-Asp) domain-containing protein
MKTKIYLFFTTLLLCAIPALVAYSHIKGIEKGELLQKSEELKSKNIINISSKFTLTGVDYKKYKFNNIQITSYNNEVLQTDDSPNITSTNRPVREGIVAVSRDFLKDGYIKYGDLMYIDCFDKWFVVEDVMNSRFEKRVDIFLFDKKESLKINKKCGIEVIHIIK